MKTKFYTSEDIRLERQKLEAELAAYKSFILQDIKDIKEELNPISTAFSFVGSAFRQGNASSLSQVGINMVVDSLASKFIPGRRILTRLVLPFIAKNIIGNTIENKGGEIFEKLKSWTKNLFKKDRDESDAAESGSAEKVSTK